MDNKTKLENLRNKLEQVYGEHREQLLFHGWHHITFTSKKAIEFAESIGADTFIVESTALTHDLNYIVQPNSEPEVGKNLREQILKESGYITKEIQRIENIVMEAHTRTRGKNISQEGKAVSDADTLFKALPITPILFASRYITQNKVDIYKLAKKVCEEQNRLMEKDIYFYTDLAKNKYLKWAKANLQLWNCVQESLLDEDVVTMLSVANKMGVL